MKPLSPADQLFLWLEKRQQPMHVGGLQLFSFPDDAPDDYVAQLADSLRNHSTVTPPFDPWTWNTTSASKPCPRRGGFANCWRLFRRSIPT